MPLVAQAVTVALGKQLQHLLCLVSEASSVVAELVAVVSLPVLLVQAAEAPQQRAAALAEMQQ